jgi:hypothetical protein
MYLSLVLKFMDKLASISNSKSGKRNGTNISIKYREGNRNKMNYLNNK